MFKELQSLGGGTTWHNDSSVGERTLKRGFLPSKNREVILQKGQLKQSPGGDNA